MAARLMSLAALVAVAVPYAYCFALGMLAQQFFGGK